MLPSNACALARWIAADDDRLVRFCTAARRAEPDCTGLQRAEGLPLVRGLEAACHREADAALIAAFYALPSSLGTALTYLRDQPAVRRYEPELFSAVNEAVTRTLGTVQSDLQLLVWPEGLPQRPPASPWARRPFRGVLSAALLLAGLGSIPTPPPREPEPDQREFDAMLAKLAEAGVDGPALLEQCGGFRHEFMRRGLIELAARDLARQGVYDIASARDILDHMSQMPDDTRISMFERLGPPKKPIPVALPISGKGHVGVLEVRGRRGPGRQLRDERERVGEPLRILAEYTGLTVVELGEIERGLRIPTPEQWAALQVALPELGPMEEPREVDRLRAETARLERERPLHGVAHAVAMSSIGRFASEAAQRHEAEQARNRMMESLLHPNGRCVCFGEGTCAWCKETERRLAEEEAREKARAATLVERKKRRPQKAEHRRSKSAKKARRGW